MAITVFKGTFLSNMWNGGKAEIVYQAMKASYTADKEMILNAKNGYEAKKLGKTIKIRRDWDQIRLRVMTEIVETKFRDPELMKKLKATAPHELIEGNYWHDNYWGDCTCDKCKNIKGENNLGKILMKVREEGERA